MEKDLTARMSELIDRILQVRYSDLESERLSCQELLELSEVCGSTYAKAFACTYMGDYYLSQSDTEKSGAYLHQARQLCTEHAYEALQMQACHLSGFFYHIIYDEQNALQYYLEALTLGHKRNDIYQICNTWNNIADMFQSHGAFNEAKQYYLRAYALMESGQCEDSRLLLMVLHNLAEVTGLLGDADGMEQYLITGEAVAARNPSEEALNKLNMMSGRCIQAALKGKRDATLEIAQRVLELGLHTLEDRYFVMELLLPMANALVELQEAECSGQYIAILTEYSSINETNFMQRLLRLRTMYAEAFSTSEVCASSYKDYYHKMQSIWEVENSVRVNGMKAKIHLQEVISQQESMQQENKRLVDVANLDALTGIYNRRYFDQCMHAAMERLPSEDFGVIMIDIDFFKQFNDTYGHLHGDHVLREVGTALKMYSGQNIHPCRYGGDEFACVCHSCTDEEIECYITKLRNHMKNLNLIHRCSGCADQVTLSIGYSNSHSSEAAALPAEIHAEADRALYQAKARGRNGWCRYAKD